MRLLPFVLLGLLSGVDVSCGYGLFKSDHYVIGKSNPNARLIYVEKNIARPFRSDGNGYQIVNWRYPENPNEVNKWEITHIVAISHFLNFSTEPYIELVEGGPGDYSVSLKLISQYRAGFEFDIYVYALVDLDDPFLKQRAPEKINPY